MRNLENPLDRLRQEDPDVNQIVDIYEEIDRVYRESREAMGIASEAVPDVMNSAEVTVSFTPPASTSDYIVD
ncbi:MAG: hypothetical protein IIA89_14565 [Chloroflexi bacterium]|nr:hypothetical protein [Chloroflexota bacterium]